MPRGLHSGRRGGVALASPPLRYFSQLWECLVQCGVPLACSPQACSPCICRFAGIRRFLSFARSSWWVQSGHAGSSAGRDGGQRTPGLAAPYG